MQIVKLGDKINCPVVVCLGFFGCMHLGHIELLKKAEITAKATSSKVALFTFSNNHLSVLNRDSSVVYTFDERLAIYNSLNIDYVITAQFDNSFKSLTGEQFLSMIAQYNLQGLVCGFDHRCGSDRLDCFGIKQYFANICPVEIIEQISVDGEKVSTSLLRNYLLSNRIDKANMLLTEPFFAIGKVEHGRSVGRLLGFPTANIQLPAEKLLPIGVYAGLTEIDGKVYHVIVNIGSRPTFGVDSVVFEVHVINYDSNLYGKTLKVSLTKYLRPITKFNSPQELSVQLQLDKENALND